MSAPAANFRASGEYADLLSPPMIVARNGSRVYVIIYKLYINFKNKLF